MRARSTFLRFAACAACAALCLVVAGASAQISVSINGEPVPFAGIGPQEYQGRVLVPLRGVLEKLGAYVDWLPATHTVVATRGDMDLQLQIGSPVARVNGRDVPLDVPAMTIAGSTMVPLRFMGETLGARVSWDAGTRTVLIQTSPNAVAQNPAPNTGAGLAHVSPRENVEVPGPAPAPARAPVSLAVSSITHSLQQGWLRTGDTLDVTLHGTPGAQASFTVPGVVQQVQMQETTPGVYQGTWTVPQKLVQVDNAAVIGTLKEGASSSPLIQAGNAVRIDTVAPRITDIYPPADSRVTRARVPISASFTDDAGSGIAIDRIKLYVDGVDQTGAAAVTDHFLTYTSDPPLPAGQHTARLVVIDAAGNQSVREWRFSVAPQEKGIQSVATDANRVLQPGDVFTVKVNGAPGSRAVFSVGTIKDVPLNEVSPGVYQGSYTVRRGDDVAGAPLVVTLTGPNGQAYTERTTRAVKVQTGPPAVPTVTYPKSGDKVSNPLVVRGTGTPNSTVRLKIDYQSRVLGIFGVRGTAAEQDVPVDAGGHWASQPIDISTLLGGTKYTLTATAVSATGQTSAPATVTFSGR